MKKFAQMLQNKLFDTLHYVVRSIGDQAIDRDPTQSTCHYSLLWIMNLTLLITLFSSLLMKLKIHKTKCCLSMEYDSGVASAVITESKTT